MVERLSRNDHNITWVLNGQKLQQVIFQLDIKEKRTKSPTNKQKTKPNKSPIRVVRQRKKDTEQW